MIRIVIQNLIKETLEGAIIDDGQDAKWTVV